ncbi:hypothetical protein [Moorena producens]|uniref:hypothetical protein n=1 Tax=Moorena producens TaxID=1155739 RepID=UPI003C74E9FC
MWKVWVVWAEKTAYIGSLIVIKQIQFSYPDSRLPTPDSRLPIPYSLFPIPYSLFPIPP